MRPERENELRSEGGKGKSKKGANMKGSKEGSKEGNKEKETFGSNLFHSEL